MSTAATLRRTLLVALASLLLCAPAAVARPADLRSEAPTSALPGSTEHDATYVLRHRFDAYPTPASPRDAALAQERSYSTYGDPPAARVAANSGATDTGIAWLPFVLAVSGALVLGLGAGGALHVVHARRRATRLAT